MRIFKIAITLALILLCKTSVFADNDRPTPILSVSIESFMKSPDKYPGVVQLEGAVSSVLPKKGKFTLIDKGELEECGLDNCAKYTLPVQWTGPLPAVKDIVRIKGKVEKVDGKRIFVTTSLKKINYKVKAKGKDED